MHPAAFLPSRPHPPHPPPSSSSSASSPISPPSSPPSSKPARPQTSPKSPSKSSSGGGFASRLRALTASSSAVQLPPPSSSSASSASASAFSLSASSTKGKSASRPSTSGSSYPSSVSSTETRRAAPQGLVSVVPYGPSHVPPVAHSHVPSLAPSHFPSLAPSHIPSLVPYGPSHVPTTPRTPHVHVRGASTASSSAGTALPLSLQGSTRGRSASVLQVSSSHPSSTRLPSNVPSHNSPLSLNPSHPSPSNPNTTANTTTNTNSSRLAHWISEQCTLVVQDHGFSPSFGEDGEEVLFSASTYVPVAMRGGRVRGDEVNVRVEREQREQGRGPGGGRETMEPGARGATGVKDGRRDSPDSVSLSLESGGEEYVGIVGVVASGPSSHSAYREGYGRERGVGVLLEEDEEEFHEGGYSGGYREGGYRERDEDARSDSPLLGFGDGDGESPPASPAVPVPQHSVSGLSPGVFTEVHEASRQGRRDETEGMDGIGETEQERDQEEENKTNHRRSKSSEETYDFPRTPGGEEFECVGHNVALHHAEECDGQDEDDPNHGKDQKHRPLVPPHHAPSVPSTPLPLSPSSPSFVSSPSFLASPSFLPSLTLPHSPSSPSLPLGRSRSLARSPSSARRSRQNAVSPHPPPSLGLPRVPTSPSLGAPVSPSPIPSPSTNGQAPKDEGRPPTEEKANAESKADKTPRLRRKRDPLLFPGRGYVRVLPSGLEGEGGSMSFSGGVNEDEVQGKEEEERTRRRSATASSTASYATARGETPPVVSLGSGGGGGLFPAAEIVASPASSFASTSTAASSATPAGTAAPGTKQSRTRSHSASAGSVLRSPKLHPHGHSSPASGIGGGIGGAGGATGGGTHVPGVQAGFHAHHMPGHSQGQGHGYSQSVSVSGASSRRGSGEGHVYVQSSSVHSQVQGAAAGTQTAGATTTATATAPAPTAPAPTAPSRASVGLGLGPGVGVRVVTRSRANSAAVLNSYAPLGGVSSMGGVGGMSGMSTPPHSPQQHQQQLHHSMSLTSLASFAAYNGGTGTNGNGNTGGMMTPPGTAGFSSGMMSAVGGTPARHAVYIVDGEEVRRRLGALLGGEGLDRVEGDFEGDEEGEGDEGDDRDEEGEGEEGKDRGGEDREQRETEMADPVLPLTDYFAMGKTEALVATVPNTPALSRSGSASCVGVGGSGQTTQPQHQQQPPSAKPSFYASPYASSSQIYLGPGGGSFGAAASGSGSVHSRGSSGGSKGSQGVHVQHQQHQQHQESHSHHHHQRQESQVLHPQQHQQQVESHERDKEKEKGQEKRTSDMLEPNPVLLASRRSSRSPRSSLAPPPASHLHQPSTGLAHLHQPSISEAVTGPHDHATTLIAHHLNAATGGALDLLPLTPTSPPPPMMTRAELESRLGPPPKRPPPAPPLDFGLSAEEVRALRARGVVGAAPRSPGLGGEGSGFRFPRGPVSAPPTSSGPSFQSTTPPPVHSRAHVHEYAHPPVSSVRVVPTERGSYFGVYPHRRSESSRTGGGGSSIGHGQQGFGHTNGRSGDVDVGEEIEAVQREMEGVLFERHRRSLSLDGHGFDEGQHQYGESVDVGYRHGVYDESFTVGGHGEEGGEAEVRGDMGRGMESGEESPYGASFAEEMGLKMERKSVLVMGDEEDTVKGRGAVPLHVAAREYRLSRPRGLSVTVPPHAQYDQYEGQQGEFGNEDPRWSMASSTILIQDFPSTPVSIPHPPPSTASPRSSIQPAPRNKHLSTASSILPASIQRASPRSSVQAPKHVPGASGSVPPSSYTASSSSKHASIPASMASKHAASASTSSASSAAASVVKAHTLNAYPHHPDDFLDTDDDDADEDVEMDEAVVMMGMSVGSVVGGMLAMPAAPVKRSLSSRAKLGVEGSSEGQGSLQSLPRRSLSKWRKRDRGEKSEGGDGVAKAKSKSAPSSPTKRASRGSAAAAAAAAAAKEHAEGAAGTAKEGKRGRLASFFSRISGRDGSPASVQSTGSGSHPHTSSHSNPNSNSGHGSPLLLLRASSRQSGGATTSTSSSNGGASEPDLRSVSGAWEPLGIERRDEEKEQVPPVPPVPPLHTLPRMASRGSLRGVAVLNNSASFSSSHSGQGGAPHSPVPGSPLNGSPRVSYVPGSVQGSPRASHVPSPIIIMNPPSTSHSYGPTSPHASTLGSSSRRTTLVSAPSQPSIMYDEESVPPTPSSIASFTSTSPTSSSQFLLLRTSRSVSNLSTVAASPLEDDVFPLSSPVSPGFKFHNAPSSPSAGRPSFSSAMSGGSLPPPPVPPKDDGYLPNDGGIPASHGRKESKGAVAGGVYVPGYEWPPSAPLPPSAFVSDSVGPVVQDGEQRKDGQGQGVLGRLRLKSSPSLGNLAQKEERKGGFRGFAARMVGRS